MTIVIEKLKKSGGYCLRIALNESESLKKIYRIFSIVLYEDDDALNKWMTKLIYLSFHTIFFSIRIK